MVNKVQGLPASTYPFVDISTGKINPVWYQCLNSLVSALNSINTGVSAPQPIVGTTGTFSGQMQFGAYSTGTFNQTGYISINDAKGIVRRLMVG